MILIIFIISQAVAPVISVSVNTTVFETLLKMRACNVHRLMIVDESGELCGLISMSDIGKFLGSEMAGAFDEGAF